MTHPRRSDAVPAYTPPQSQFQPATDGYRPGGRVGRMQAELAHRLAPSGLTWELADAPTGENPREEPGEQIVRFLSVAGGYLALLLAYAGVALPFLR